MIYFFNFFAVETESPEGLAALGLDMQAFLVQLVTFLLVLLVLKKFVFQKVVDVLDKRQKTIEEGVRLSSEMQEEKARLEVDIAESRAKARADADEVLAASKGKASEIIKQAEEEAKVKSDQILKDAKQKITEETNRARRNLESEMVELVIAATEKVSRGKIDVSKDKDLITSALKEHP